MTAISFTHGDYRLMLEAGRKAGYRFATFDELDAMRDGTGRACFLRHDCDNDVVAALALAEIEADAGVRSTYFIMVRSALYNVMAPNVAALVRKIVVLGHRLGLHFDEAPYRDLSADQIADAVDRERGWLVREFGQTIDVVSFHQPSARVLANEVRLKGCLNTYDKKDMAPLHYLSDSNLRFRAQSPIECFEAGTHRLLHILLHPEWWTEVQMPLDDKWNRMLMNNFGLMQKSLLEREDTYNEPRSISIGTRRDEDASTA
jgi:hypothetical protein